MDLAAVTFQPIGIVRSEHRSEQHTPIQPVCAEGSAGRVEILDEYASGLEDIEGFSHIYLLYHLHRAGPARLGGVPFLDDVPHGIFATRSPWRANALEFSLVRLVRREGATLIIDDVDVLDGTPLLDIKPYVARFDAREGARCGRTDGVDAQTFASAWNQCSAWRGIRIHRRPVAQAIRRLLLARHARSFNRSNAAITWIAASRRGYAGPRLASQSWALLIKHAWDGRACGACPRTFRHSRSSWRSGYPAASQASKPPFRL